MGTVTAMKPTASAPAAQPSAEPRLRVDAVSLRYQSPKGETFTALDRVSLEVPDQQFAAIVGPSGCGKSSLLYLTAGLSEPSDGAIYVGGQQVRGPGADRGMVFQGYTLFPWLTVRQNVEFGLKRRGLRSDEINTTVEYFLNEVGLRKFANHYPKQLSGGMMQRVAIARALANDPQILLMDEPFGALDSQTRLQMQKLLLQIWEHTRKTVVFVTHDIDEAILLADRIFVMGARPGRIKRILDVPLARPRDMDVVMEPAFIAMKREILELLHDDLEEPH